MYTKLLNLWSSNRDRIGRIMKSGEYEKKKKKMKVKKKEEEER